MHNDSLFCPVCGLEQDEAPWGADGKTPSFEICVCCGVEFGIEDYTIEGAKSYRQRWLANGAKWYVPELKPENWDLEKQLDNLKK